MQVDATLFDGYILRPRSNELALFLGLFGGKVRPVSGGWSFLAYDAVPEILIKGFPVLEKVPEATRSFDTPAQALHSLKLGVELTSGKPLDVSAGLYMPARMIGNSKTGSEADHIPQVYGKYPTPKFPDRVCVAVHGEYDLTRRAFFGQVSFTKLGALWSA